MREHTTSYTSELTSKINASSFPSEILLTLYLASDTHSSTSSIQNQSFPLLKPVSELNGPSPPSASSGPGEGGDVRNRFHSDKICDISYANIQGKESLIEKFRNSCVMDEDPSYRPKIFHSNGPLVGQEQEFPEPNNTRRKLRSIACARQIGSSLPIPRFHRIPLTYWFRTFPSFNFEKGPLTAFGFTMDFADLHFVQDISRSLQHVASSVLSVNLGYIVVGVVCLLLVFC